jgi:HNH endonuclease
MPSGFNRNEVAALLVQCHRRCCICHRFCGTKMETDHIVPAAESHDHSIENAIPVCFDCHAEIHAYNPSHPRGRRFTSDELRAHKEQWLRICETRPEIFVEAARQVDIGPLQGLLDELDYNLIISRNLDFSNLGFQFRDTQMERAIREGIISIVDDDLRMAISSAYGMVSRANESTQAWLNRHDRYGTIDGLTLDAVQRTIPLIQQARDRLLQFVQSESDESQ